MSQPREPAVPDPEQQRTRAEMPPPMPPPMPAAPGYGTTPVTGVPAGTELASVGRRIGAFFLRFVLFVVTLGIGYIVWGIVTWTRGTTPALQVLGCRLWVPDQQQMPGFWRAVLRNLVGFVVEGLIFPIVAIVSFVLFLTNAEHRALHDLIGGTVVVHDPSKVLG